MFWIFFKRGNSSIKKGQRVKKSTFEEKMDKTMDKLKIMDKSNGQIGNNGQIMDKNDLKWILNGLNGNHTLGE